MPKIKADDMAGTALDWAVAKATEACEIKITAKGKISCIYQDNDGGCWTNYYSPSSDWDQCGLLLSAYNIMVYPSLDIETSALLYWVAVVETANRAHRRGWLGETPQVAICRALVGTKLGYRVDVPAELLEANNA